MTHYSSKFLLALSLVAGCAGEERLSSTVQHTGCDGTNDWFINENGDEEICIYTDEEGDDPDYPSPDICFYYPEYCYPAEPPEPPDPCALNPDACGGGDPGPSVCSTVDSVPPNFAQLVNTRVESCFERNWSSQGFVEQTDASGWYTPGQGAWYYSVADWLTENVTSCVVSGIDWMFYSGSQADQIMNNLVARLNTQAATQNLTPHQRMCSALCVSGKLINYANENFQNALPSGAVTNGVGTCREFAAIGERLLDGMGFSSSITINTAQSHAFVEVTSPSGGTFYVEPQPGDCVFYNRH